MKINITIGCILECLASLLIGFVTVFAVFKQMPLILTISVILIFLVGYIISYRLVRFAGTKNLLICQLIRPKNIGGLIRNTLFVDVCGISLSMLCTVYYINVGIDMGFYLAILLAILFFCMSIPTLFDYAMPSESSRQLIFAVDDLFQDVIEIINENNISDVSEKIRQAVINLPK